MIHHPSIPHLEEPWFGLHESEDGQAYACRNVAREAAHVCLRLRVCEGVGFDRGPMAMTALAP